MRTLIVNIATTSRASYYNDWEDAFQAASFFESCETRYFNKRADAEYIENNITSFDLIVLLHACSADTALYLKGLMPVLDKRKGKLFVFIGNEYNMPVNPLSDRIKAINDLKPDFVATQLLQETGSWLYSDISSAKIISVPHALSNKNFSPGKDYKFRMKDFGIRSFRYPPYLGDIERNKTIDFVCKYAKDKGFHVDSSFSERLDRTNWSEFLKDTKFTVSTEAGTRYIRPSDDLVKEIHAFIMSNTKETSISSQNGILRQLASMLPYSVKGKIRTLFKKVRLRFDDDTSGLSEDILSEIEDRFFKNIEKSPHTGKCISSRHLDAIGTKTAQILLEGSYNGIILPSEHYISLNSDYSNIEEIFSYIQDEGYINSLVNRAYDFISNNHTHKHRVEYICSIISG